MGFSQKNTPQVPSLMLLQQGGFPDYRRTAPVHLLMGQQHRQSLATHHRLDLKWPVPSRCSGQLGCLQDVRPICPEAGYSRQACVVSFRSTVPVTIPLPFPPSHPLPSPETGPKQTSLAASAWCLITGMKNYMIYYFYRQKK